MFPNIIGSNNKNLNILKPKRHKMSGSTKISVFVITVAIKLFNFEDVKKIINVADNRAINRSIIIIMRYSFILIAVGISSRFCKLHAGYDKPTSP